MANYSAAALKSLLPRVLAGKATGSNDTRSDVEDPREPPYDRLSSSSSEDDNGDAEEGNDYVPHKVVLPPGIINPDSQWYRGFWYLTVAAAFWTGVIKPYTIAFETDPRVKPFSNVASLHEYVLTTIFLVDLILKFRLAFRSQEQLIGDQKQIQKRYLEKYFWIDAAALLPLDFLILCIAAGPDAVSHKAVGYFQLTRLLRLLRMYRVPQFFLHLEYKLTVSLLAVTLVRNFVFTYFSIHWSACMFYFIARQYGFGRHTWIGAHSSLLKDSTHFERYLYSLYWSMTTLATVGYGDFTAQNVAETVWATIYMLYNLALSAYILGSFTLLVIRGDERVGNYRSKCSNLRKYSKSNHIPKHLRDSMQGHLRLHFETEQASDEKVLAAYPATIRRRILRHLYGGYLHRTYLLAGCKQKFLDALLAVVRVELYMPREDILVEGDFVNELFVVVSGVCEVIPSGSHPGSEDVPMADDGTTSVRGGCQYRRELGLGKLFGEVAFFTECPQTEGVRAGAVVRVLTVSRTAYNTVAAAFPLGARTLLENLREHSQEVVNEQFKDRGQQRRLAAELHRLGSEHLSLASSGGVGSRQNSQMFSESTGDLAALSFSWASPETMPDGSDRSQTGSRRAVGGSGDDGGGSSGDQRRGSMGPHRQQSGSEAASLLQRAAGSRGGLSPQQEQVLASAMRIRALVAAAVAKSDETRTNMFLSAASHGDTDTVLQMLQQGFDCEQADYDGRTGLMLAAAKGHTGIARLLLAAKADVNAMDLGGGTALDEACKHAHDAVITLLKRKGARLGGRGVALASQLCTAVFEGDLPLLRRLLKSGADANACDYDKRTALHIAAADSNHAAVKLLVEEGDADPNAQDRWGSTALQEAQRVRCQAVIEFLRPRTTCNLEQVPSSHLPDDADGAAAAATEAASSLAVECSQFFDGV